MDVTTVLREQEAGIRAGEFRRLVRIFAEHDVVARMRDSRRRP
jgi:hypothetical protein